MPYYVYRCQECSALGESFFHSHEDFNKTFCKGCGGALDKIPSLPCEASFFETLGTYQKKRVIKGIAGIMKKRAHEHVRDRGEMREMIEKEGENFGVEKGFIKNGKIIKSIDEK